MVDFNVFDSILDCAVVVDAHGLVVYCNESAATFFQLSIRRIVGRANVADLFAIGEAGILPFGPKSLGYQSPSSFIETSFVITKGSNVGTCQLAVRPLDQAHWVLFVRDVSLEAALHTKYRSELAQKEDYARNLERLVEARTAELSRVNSTLNAILDSLGQGFFTFDAAGRCGNVFTRACQSVLDGVPEARPVTEVLAVAESERGQFAKWSETLFAEPLPFEDLRPLGPEKFGRADGRHVTLEYYPIRRDDRSISDVVVVATDKTAEFEAQRALEVERQYAGMVVKYLKNKDQFLRFLSTVGPNLDRVINLARAGLSSADVNEAFRTLHTIEGEAGAFSMRELRASSRECQHVLEPWRVGGRSPDAITHQNLIEACVAARAQFEAFLVQNQDIIRLPDLNCGRTVEVPVRVINELCAEVGALNDGAAVVARYADQLLREPIANHLRYFDGLMGNVAERLDKRVNPLVIEGGEVRINPDDYRDFFASLVHLFRNAIDHGLESPLEREWAGKPAAGTVRATVVVERGVLRLTVSDDGRGIDPAALRQVLKKKFPDEDPALLSDYDVIQSICRPGFSSRDEVGEFSGRGVGLDALREEVLRLGGTLVVKSKLNEGTAIEVTLPPVGAVAGLLKGA